MDSQDPKAYITHDEIVSPGLAKGDGAVEHVRMRESRMEEALIQENPKAWRRSFVKLYACIFVGYLCSATNGFDANTFGMVPFPDQCRVIRF